VAGHFLHGLVKAVPRAALVEVSPEAAQIHRLAVLSLESLHVPSQLLLQARSG
jgi:hypothetical protein